MRPKHPHAAESGVGKHTARESERVQACAAGKERVTHAHPQNLASGSQDPGALFFSGFKVVGKRIHSLRRFASFNSSLASSFFPHAPLRC